MEEKKVKPAAGGANSINVCATFFEQTFLLSHESLFSFQQEAKAI
jgi:hypothetical protein